MNIQRAWEVGKTTAQAAFVLAFVGWCSYDLGNRVVQTYSQWDEPRYLMPTIYDPILRNIPSIAMSEYACYSPAHCEPNSHPSPRYFRILTATEVREWGFDPAHEIPLKNDPFIY